jgi:hypothetical protein
MRMGQYNGVGFKKAKVRTAWVWTPLRQAMDANVAESAATLSAMLPDLSRSKRLRGPFTRLTSAPSVLGSFSYRR